MSALRRSPTRCLRWLPLVAVAACLNPQPDDGPLHRPLLDEPVPAAPAGNGTARASDPTPLQDEDVKSPQSTPPAELTETPPGVGNGADAGAPSPLDAGNQGDLVERDAAD
ncbi:MAG: hypothetical protein ABI895_27310 [Deltaproteobacteria bacterium]